MDGAITGRGFTRRSIAATKIISLAFLGVLGVLAVKERFRIHRQDAKSAKNLAKQNSFQESKDFRLNSTERPSRNRNIITIPISVRHRER